MAHGRYRKARETKGIQRNIDNALSTWLETTRLQDMEAAGTIRAGLVNSTDRKQA